MGRAPSKKKWKALALVYHRRSQTPNERFACEGHPSVPDGLTSTNGRKSPDTRGCEDTTHLDSGRAGCALFSMNVGVCDLLFSLFPGSFAGARSLRFRFFVWANSLGPIRDLANVARAKHKRRDGQGRNEKKKLVPARDRTWNLRNFIEIFNEPVSLGKQFKCCSKRRAIGFLFDDK